MSEEIENNSDSLPKEDEEQEIKEKVTDDSKEFTQESTEMELTEEEIAAEKERIEEDLRNLARQYEKKGEDKPRPTLNQVLTSLGFALGPIFLIFLLSIQSWDFYREITVPLSGLITILLFGNVFFVSWKKSKVID